MLMSLIDLRVKKQEINFQVIMGMVMEFQSCSTYTLRIREQGLFKIVTKYQSPYRHF